MDFRINYLHIWIMDTHLPPALPFRHVALKTPPQILNSEPHWRGQVTLSGHHKLWIALDGMGQLTCHERSYPISAGTAFLFTPGDRISATHDPRYPIKNFAAHLLLPEPWPNREVLGIRLQEVAVVKDLCRSAARCALYPGALAQQQYEGLCFQILAWVWRDVHARKPKEPDHMILESARQMAERPSAWKSVAEFAREAGYSIPQFNRRFKGLIGCSPAQYSIQHRIRRAKELLEHSSLQIGEIAEALGYRDLYYFSRQFKAVSKQSPQQYRAAHSSDLS